MKLVVCAFETSAMLWMITLGKLNQVQPMYYNGFEYVFYPGLPSLALLSNFMEKWKQTWLPG